MNICAYCFKSRPEDEPGWHGCKESIEGRKRLAKALRGIDEVIRGGQEPRDVFEETEKQRFKTIRLRRYEDE